MGLETTVNFISDLNPLNPAEGDLAKDGDNHIRLIKAAVKQTFTNLTGAVTATQGELNKLAGLSTSSAELAFLVGATSNIQAQIDSLIPAGVITEFGGVSAPPGRWLLCNGQAVSRTGIYANLFSAIGTTFGVGDGYTTFNVPDMRGVSPRGLDSGRGLDPGRTLGSYQPDTLLNHTHSGATFASGAHTHGVNDPGHTHGFTETGGNGGFGGGEGYSSGGFQLRSFNRTTAGSGTGIWLNWDGGHTHTFTTNGVDASFNSSPENRVKTVALNYIIRY